MVFSSIHEWWSQETIDSFHSCSLLVTLPRGSILLQEVFGERPKLAFIQLVPDDDSSTAVPALAPRVIGVGCSVLSSQTLIRAFCKV